MAESKEVLISLHCLQDCDSGEPDITDFSTDGLFVADGREYSLHYFESEVIGEEGTMTTVRITDGQVVIERTGSMDCTMVLREGSRESFAYPTPYGSISMKVDTRRICQSFDSNGGSLEIEYIISMEHVHITRNRLQLKVTEIKEIGGWNNG